MMNTQTITIEVRSVYGQTKLYPACQRSQQFADLIGTKTLTARAVKQIEAMGYEVVSVSNADWRIAA